ncbi:MAG: hypothetical protein Q9159_006972 [Coniocarpon cinnabarinum]
MRRLIPELDIFKPVPASLKDENDWPIFTINNAEVTYEGTSELANLLLNDDEHLMTVTGHITQLDREEKCHLIDRDSIPCSITIASVQRFSFGQYDDGVVTFWVRGRAGWFEIVPSRRYKPFLEEMVQVIRILYFLADTLHEMPTRKQQRRANPDTLFRQYAEDDEHKCEDAQEARRRFIKHKRPLLTLMSQGKEGIAWKPTAIYKYLDSHHDEVSSSHPLRFPPRPTRANGATNRTRTSQKIPNYKHHADHKPTAAAPTTKKQLHILPAKANPHYDPRRTRPRVTLYPKDPTQIMVSQWMTAMTSKSLNPSAWHHRSAARAKIHSRIDRPSAVAVDHPSTRPQHRQ